MQIIFIYIQNNYVKKKKNYMPLHKLNQAKNTSCHLKKNKKQKNYVHFQMSLFFF